MQRQRPSATMMLGLWVIVVPGGSLSAAAQADTRDDEWEIQRDSPIILHATALNYEIDGDLDQALELLRAAIELAPDDTMIAFDLARIAFDADSDELEADVASFLAHEPESEDARLLKAYIMLHLGQRQAADEQLAAVLAASPDHAEAARLRDVVMHAGLGDTPSDWLSASLRVGVEFDSNVTVIPDTPSRLEGVRISADGNVTVVPLREPTELMLSGAFRVAPHLNE